MAETQIVMDETQEDMDDKLKDMAETQIVMTETQIEMAETQIEMAEAQIVLDEIQEDMDDKLKDMAETQIVMEETQKEMDDTPKDMVETQIVLDETPKDMDETQKEMDDTPKEMVETQIVLDETPKDMDETQIVMDETPKEMDEMPTSYLFVTEGDSRSGSLGGQRKEEVDGEVPVGLLETEKTPGQGLGTLEQLRQRQQEDQEEMEELNRRREEKRRAREEEEHQREKEEQHRQEQEEEERKRVKDGMESKRMSASERRMKNLSISSIEGDESFSPFSPMSPTFKNDTEERMTSENTCTINERTESLNRSLQKSNSIKKTQPPIPISKIDNRLEQYTHAIETSSKEAKAARQQALMDLPSPTEPVASKKNLFEAGEAWSQTPRETPSKDTEGLNVGVADLIHQWVKGNPDGSCKSLSKPAEVKAGDVLSKKNLWENLGDSSPAGRAGKGASSGKKYKFVMMAHGKYEKVAIGDDDYNEHTNGKSSKTHLHPIFT
ncbi:caldesmon, smooth muscle isoform X1 [Salmo trutta]|uniref:caldesmon, smooth muscle isoform X1 n=1 Tax=Salmo trutta TaxID=8032 RepID=UPI0011315EB1|nr:caldesmon, smooth muscle-like isoform X1 [Salmo trutta]XP_029624277.1 caldesmon, smooth muscle-like isoform X1 [Salmo trutta]